MAKITLNDITTEFRGQAQINNNFTSIENEFQNKVLYRNNPGNESNSMQNHLDMNGFNLLNVGNPTSLGISNATAANIPYENSATGAITVTVQSKLSESISVKDFGAVGDGVTDDTVAINSAVAATAPTGRALYFPIGTYIVSQINVLPKMNLIGESSTGSVIKLKNNTNPAEGVGALVWSSSYDMDDASIQNLRFDGNKANNSRGNVICLYGNRTVLYNVIVVNAASNAIITNHNPAGAERLSGIEAHFRDITIDSPNKSGWLHYGPNDSNFDNIIIIDAGLGATNSFYGMYLGNDVRGVVTTTGNGRFNNLHPWNRGSTTNVPLAGVQVNTSGNTFVNCHFECGDISLNIDGNFNTFSSCDYYAPDGPAAIYVAGNGNNISGTTWHFPTLPAYKGVVLEGFGNTLTLTCDSGNPTSAFTVIDFGDSATGYNNVSITGYISALSTPYVGTPSTNDTVNITLSGPGAAVFTQIPAVSWEVWTPVFTASSGTITAYTVNSARYLKRGKEIQVRLDVTITTNGTAASSLLSTLPVSSVTNGGVLAGREDVVSGKMLQGKVSGSTLTILNYDNTYPGADTARIILSGVYESA